MILVDVQHRGTNSAPATVRGVSEVDFTAALAEAMLEQAPDQVELVPSLPTYAARHRWAADRARGRPERFAYLALHANAGGGDYGMALWDARSTGGQQLAEAIAAALADSCYLELAGVARWLPASRTWLGPGSPWPSRALGTIDGIYNGPPNLFGVCLEPLFLDSHYAAAVDDLVVGELARVLVAVTR